MTPATEFVSVGRIEGGKLKFTQDQLRHLQAGLSRMADGEVIHTISHPRATRDARLNRLYWAGYVKPFSEHTGYTPMEIHEYFKRRFLAGKRLVIVDSHGEVKEEAEIPVLTTTKLTQQEFKDYLKDIETLAFTLDIHVGSNQESRP